MDEAFVCLVVGVREENLPVGRDCVIVDGKAVILGGDETSLSGRVNAGLVVTTIAVSVCVCVCACMCSVCSACSCVCDLGTRLGLIHMHTM